MLLKGRQKQVGKGGRDTSLTPPPHTQPTVLKKCKNCPFKNNESSNKLLYVYLVSPLEEEFHELFKVCNTVMAHAMSKNRPNHRADTVKTWRRKCFH